MRLYHGTNVDFVSIDFGKSKILIINTILAR